MEDYGDMNGECTTGDLSFYAVTAERRLKHPAIVAITESARLKVFGQE